MSVGHVPVLDIEQLLDDPWIYRLRQRVVISTVDLEVKGSLVVPSVQYRQGPRPINVSSRQAVHWWYLTWRS